MDPKKLAQFAQLSPFEFKDVLIQMAQRHSEKMMLNAGRGNPNFLSLAPRNGFFQLGLFAMTESERSFGYMTEGFGGHAEREGIEARFEIFVNRHRDVPGVHFLHSAMSYVKGQLGFSAGDHDKPVPAAPKTLQ